MSATATASIEQPLVKICGGTRRAREALLIERAVSLIEAGTAPERILLSAPSALGADQLSQRLRAALSSIGRDARIDVRPALQLCSDAVEQARAAGLTERFGRVLPAEEQLFLFEDMKTLGQKNQRLHNMLAFFNAQWSNLEPEGQWVIAGEESTVIALLRQLLAQYEGGLRDEVPYLAAHLLESEGPKALGVDYDYVLCDDFQNLSRAEQTALSLMCAKQLVVAGDEAQATKGATAYPHPSGFANFERLRRGAVVVDLGDEGRSDTATARLAWERPEQELESLPQLVRAWEASSPAAGPGDVIVAVPTRFWGRLAVQALAREGIATDDAGLGRALGGDPRTPGHHEGLSAYSKLLLAAQPESALAWRLWGGFDHALTHSDLWLEVRHRANRDNATPYEAFRAMAQAALAGEEVPFKDSVAAIWESGQEVIARSRGLQGTQLLEALAIAPDKAPASFAGTIADGEDAAALLARIRETLVAPRFSKGQGAARVVLYQNAAGIDASCVLLPGLVNGLMPHRDIFDILKDPPRRESLKDEEAARLRTAAEIGQMRVVSHFTRSDIELAERARMHVERIASQDGRRTARVSASSLLPAAALDVGAEEGSASAIEALFTAR